MTDVRRVTLGGGRTLEVEVDPDLPGFTAGRVLRAEGSVQLWTFELFGARVFDLDGEPLEVRFDPGGGIYAMWQGKRIEPDAPSWVKWGFALSTGAAGAVLVLGAVGCVRSVAARGTVARLSAARRAEQPRLR